MAERRAGRTRKDFRRKYGRSLDTSRKPIHPYGKAPSGRRVAGKRRRLTCVSRGMQEEWGAGVSQWVARREIERVNLYFRRKMGILKGHSTDEWKEGYGEWQDRALMSQAWKWLRRPRKPMPRSRAKRRIVACVRESVDRSASSRRRRISSPRQAAPKTEAREAKPERNRKTSADHLVTEDSDEVEILSTEPVAATYEGIYVLSQKTEKRHGPYTMMQLQKLVDQGYYTPHDLAIYQGLEQWVTLEHVPDIMFPVVEAPAEPEAEPEPVAEEILAPEEDAPTLTTELVEDAESDQRQAEAPGKRNLAGFLFRMAAPTFAALLLLLWLCDVLNQHMGWNIPIGLGGISTTDDAKESEDNQSQDVADRLAELERQQAEAATSKSNDIAALTAELERTKKELASARSATPPAGARPVVPVPNTVNPPATPATSPSPFDPLPTPDVETSGKAFTIPDLSMEMLWVKPGTFEMGSPTSEAGRSKYETQHQVTLTEGFWLGKYEVTQAQWQKVMGNNPSHFKGAGRPVEKVSWIEVTSFCDKLTALEREAGRLPAGKAYQLPTEAQWEYACRAGTKTAFSFGDGLMSRQANISGGPRETTDVGKYPANGWGFHDMHGNVWEWCADWYGDYPTGAARDPVGPAVGSYRVARGGSWYFTANFARSANRFRNEPAISYVILGFRLSLRPPASQ